jgi:hypothetical protein
MSFNDAINGNIINQTIIEKDQTQEQTQELNSSHNKILKNKVLKDKVLKDKVLKDKIQKTKTKLPKLKSILPIIEQLQQTRLTVLETDKTDKNSKNDKNDKSNSNDKTDTTEKVNIVIKSCKNISSKQALLIIPITKFFSNRLMLNKIITILKGESISLRLIDWFVTNYCKKFNILYNVYDYKDEISKIDKTPEQLQSFDNYIIVHNNYKGQLKAYSKRNFDPFCRRNRIRFYYEDNKYFITTVGQLNFFKWALEQHIVDYIEKHLKLIDVDMNLRCETVKKTGTKLNPSTLAASIQLDDDGMLTPIQLPEQPSQSLQQNSLQQNSLQLIPIQLPQNIQLKKSKAEATINVDIHTSLKGKKTGGSTRKKRKEISSAASKSLSIHNFPTTLVFD